MTYRIRECSSYLRSKNIEITWMPEMYGEIQRALQAIKELLYNENAEKLERMLKDFSVYNRKGVMAAEKMVGDGMLLSKNPSEYGIEEIFNRLAEMISETEDI